MSSLTYEQQQQLTANREYAREGSRAHCEKLGDAKKFRNMIAFDQQARQRPIYWGGLK